MSNPGLKLLASDESHVSHNNLEMYNAVNKVLSVFFGEVISSIIFYMREIVKISHLCR